MPLPQPLIGPLGPQGLADIEAHFKAKRFIPALLFLLRQRGADVTVERRLLSAAPLVAAAPNTAQLSKAARDVFGTYAGLAPNRPAPTDLPGATPLDTAPGGGTPDPAFAARILLIDDNYTASDALFASDFTEQRCITLAPLHPGDVLRYVRDDGRRRSYRVESAPMVLGGTTDILLQFVIAPATE